MSTSSAQPTPAPSARQALVDRVAALKVRRDELIEQLGAAQQDITDAKADLETFDRDHG